MKPPGPRTSSRELHIDIARGAKGWSPSLASIRTWAGTALGRHGAGREISVRMVGPRESQQLNARYRQRDKPTNVLSFPSGPMPEIVPQPLGDLVICPQVLRAEALAQGKTLRAHWAHLVVHGALHLVGYDHEREADARRMERREIAVLRRLGFTNPYRVA